MNKDAIISLAKTISIDLHKWYGSESVLRTDSVELMEYPYSFFVRFPIVTPGESFTLLAKIHRKPYIKSLTTAISDTSLKAAGYAEYEITRKMWSVFSKENSSTFMSIQPLAYLEEWNAILMRKVDGKLLKEYLFTPSFMLRKEKAIEQLQNYLSAAVNWLRVFHYRVADMRLEKFPVQDAMDSMDNILNRLSRHVDVTGYRRALIKKISDIRSLLVPVCLLHDDFQYSNIIVENRGRVCVLDYAMNHRSCTYSDIATLLIDPRTRGLQVWSLGGLIPKKIIQSLDRTIIETYFRSETFHKPVLDYFCALAILNKWQADESGNSNNPKTIPLRRLPTLVRSYYNELLLYYI